MAGIDAKSLLRKEILRRRKLLSEDKASDLSKQLKAHLMQWIGQHSVSVCHCFLPIEQNREVNTWPIIEELYRQDKNIILTRTDFDSEEMHHFEYHPDLEFELDRFKIPSPIGAITTDISLVDVIFIPLLAADKKGGRIGYGKGYYDRLLQEMTSDAIKIGLTLGSCFDKFSFLEPHDQKLDYCITPYEVVNCYE